MTPTRYRQNPFGMSKVFLTMTLLVLIGCGGDVTDSNPPPSDSEPIKVSGTPTNRGLDEVFGEFSWAPDSTRIAYLARQASVTAELYTSTPDGQINEAVSPVPLPTSGEVDSFAWAPDSSRLAYRADQDTPNVFELYTSNPDGTDNQNVSRSGAFGTLRVTDYSWAISEASRRILVFIARALGGNTFELYASIDNGITVNLEKLSDIVIDGTQVVDFAVSPDGQQVVYRADQDVFNTFELYVVPVEGGFPTRISRTAGSILDVEDYAWSFDSSAIAFRAFDPTTNPPSGNIQLFTARPFADFATVVSIFPPPDGDVRDFAWSPTSLLLAYTLNDIQGTPNKFNLWATRAFSLGDNNVLSNNPGTGSNISTVTDYRWSPDGLLVAFLANVSTTGINELLVADPTQIGAPPVPLSGTLQSLGAVTQFQWQPNSFRIAYRADQFLDQRFDLLTVVADGSRSPVLISELAFSNSEVTEFSWAPDSSRIAYIADKSTVGIFELFTDNAVGTNPRQVSPDITTGKLVFDFAWAPDSSVIAYQSNQDDITKFELYTTLP